jgi:aldose 1-epimerase
MKNFSLFLAFLAIASCTPPAGSTLERVAESKPIPGKDEVSWYVVKNTNGLVVELTNLGATITSIQMPDKNGDIEEITLGYHDKKEYLDNKQYFGSLVGRYANRIAKGTFELDNKRYRLALNNGPNHLHGGIEGFHKVIWQGKPFTTDTSGGVSFTYLSKHMEEGYPGTLEVEVRYTLDDKNQLKVDYQASAQRATIVNLTNHVYFNLNGKEEEAILDHALMIPAKAFTPVDSTLIPTGEIREVENTPFDFRKMQLVGPSVQAENKQVAIAGGGIDHNFVLNKTAGKLGLAARLHENKTGRTVELYTTQPGLQVYTGNFLDSSITGLHGKAYNKYAGIALEPQYFPDSPNKPHFPSVVIRPGEAYQEKVLYRFLVE